MFRMRRRPVLIWIKMQSLLSKYEAMGIGSLHLRLIGRAQEKRCSYCQSDSSHRYNDDGERTLIGSKFVVTPLITRHRRKVP